MWGDVEAYIRDIISTYKNDPRIVIWDLYNEPTNRMIFTTTGEIAYDEEMEAFSHDLMEKAFEWARVSTQPIVKRWSCQTSSLSTRIYHSTYSIKPLKLLKATEQLPLFKQKNIGCYQWGLVKGKTQTHLPWPEIKRNDVNYASQWFHDLLDEQGQPYDVSEVQLITIYN